MSTPRQKKPTLDRHEPIRAFNGVFGRPAQASGASSSATNGAKPRPADGASRGVDLGYRVIEEYMRQGQSFAQAAWPSAAMGPVPGVDPQKLMERMVQYASDLATAWLEYAQATMGQMPFTPPAAGAASKGGQAPHVGAFETEGKPAPQPQPSAVRRTAFDAPPPPLRGPLVVVEVASKKRVEVSVDAKPGAASLSLAAHDLRAGDVKLPRIAGVVAIGEPEANRVLVRLTIPDDQPTGTYSGLVVDELNLPQATVCVRVLQP